MKTLILQNIILDIDERNEKFDELRINKKKPTKRIAAEIAVVDEIVNKKPHLSVVKDENVFDDDLELQLELQRKQKLINFVRKDDYFLTEEEIAWQAQQNIEPIVKETKGFFKAISNFFVDDAAKKQAKVAPIKKQVFTPIQEEITAEPIVLEKIETIEAIETIEIKPTEEEIRKEIEIKAEKLRVIEEEYRLKAEKREADEKLLNEQKTVDVKKANADFRKNKRKK